MNRRDLFRLSGAMGLTGALPGLAHAAKPNAAAAAPLKAPATGSIVVAFLLSDDAVVIDFAGPWEVFSNVSVPGRDEPTFQLYTVAETREPIKASAGMTIVPEYTFATAPVPHVIVIPAQSTRSEAALAWIRTTAQSADLTMSVCTGAFLLARTGLLSGKAATTHHAAYKEFAMKYPDITLKRGARFVEAGNVASAGGLSSGIDLALRVVERYFGRTVASNTAYTLEYQGKGWLDAGANETYTRQRSASGQPICPVCDMEVDKGTATSSVYRGKTYYFCFAGHKQTFDAQPRAYVAG